MGSRPPPCRATALLEHRYRAASNGNIHPIGQPFAAFDEGDVDRHENFVVHDVAFATFDDGRHRTSRKFRCAWRGVRRVRCGATSIVAKTSLRSMTAYIDRH